MEILGRWMTCLAIPTADQIKIVKSLLRRRQGEQYQQYNNRDYRVQEWTANRLIRVSALRFHGLVFTVRIPTHTKSVCAALRISRFYGCLQNGLKLHF